MNHTDQCFNRAMSNRGPDLAACTCKPLDYQSGNQSADDDTYSTAAEWVVTFNRIDDFRGLRRMTKEEADKLAAYAARLNYRQARVVRITRTAESD